jgi:hypothetical protein
MRKGHWQIYDSSTAFRSDVPGMSLRQVVQELQIGGARLPGRGF